MSRDYPNDLRYTKDHEWARVEGGIATIGITPFAVEQLGDITMVDLPKEGEKTAAGQVLGTVESVKAVSDIYSPVSGEIVKVNDPILENPEMLGEDPYDEGWLVQVRLSNPKELEPLMDGDQYEKYLAEQDH